MARITARDSASDFGTTTKPSHSEIIKAEIASGKLDPDDWQKRWLQLGIEAMDGFTPAEMAARGISPRPRS